MLAWTFPNWNPAFSSKHHVMEETPELYTSAITTGGHASTLRENRAEQGVRQPLTCALISETQPQSRRAKPKHASAPSQQSALLNHLPEPLAATCRSAQISITHHTQSGGHFMALFTQGCLSCLPSTFLPGAIYPQHKHSGLIKAFIQLQADARL